MFLIDAPVAGAYHLVTALTAVVPPAVAIVILTVAVRAALLPLAISAARSVRARARLAPQAGKLQRKYAEDPERLLRETSAMYRREGVSLTGGLLPVLAQAPFFVVLYQLFVRATIGGQANVLLTHTLLTAPLGQSWIGVAGTAGLLSVPSAVFAGLVALLVLVAWWTSRRLPAGTPALVRLLPFGTVVFALFTPLAAGLYLLVSGTWTAGERLALARP